ASDDPAATQRGGQPCGTSRCESSAGPLVPGQSIGAHCAVFLRAKGSRILLYAPETFGPRESGTCERGPRTRSGEPADLGNAGTRGGLQPVLFEQDFFARSRSHYSAIFTQCSDGTRR